MPHMTQRKCKNCGDPFMARTADVNRGWAKFCSKSCKATRQVQRGGKYQRYQHQQEYYNLDKAGHEP